MKTNVSIQDKKLKRLRDRLFIRRIKIKHLAQRNGLDHSTLFNVLAGRTISRRALTIMENAVKTKINRSIQK